MGRGQHHQLIKCRHWAQTGYIFNLFKVGKLSCDRSHKFVQEHNSRKEERVPNQVCQMPKTQDSLGLMMKATKCGFSIPNHLMIISLFSSFKVMSVSSFCEMGGVSCLPLACGQETKIGLDGVFL